MHTNGQVAWWATEKWQRPTYPSVSRCKYTFQKCSQEVYVYYYTGLKVWIKIKQISICIREMLGKNYRWQQSHEKDEGRKEVLSSFILAETLQSESKIIQSALCFVLCDAEPS